MLGYVRSDPCMALGGTILMLECNSRKILSVIKRTDYVHLFRSEGHRTGRLPGFFPSPASRAHPATREAHRERFQNCPDGFAGISERSGHPPRSAIAHPHPLGKPAPRLSPSPPRLLPIITGLAFCKGFLTFSANDLALVVKGLVNLAADRLSL